MYSCFDLESCSFFTCAQYEEWAGSFSVEFARLENLWLRQGLFSSRWALSDRSLWLSRQDGQLQDPSEHSFPSSTDA